MENRVPLTTNKVLKRIEELPVGSNLDLTNSGIVSAVSIQSETFYGNLVGIASTALTLTTAEGILSGRVDNARLTGSYDIDITGTADKLKTAENILDGIVSPDRLSGLYNIDITGTADYLQDAVGIVTGTLNRDRLVGYYAIDVDYARRSGVSTQVSTRSATSPGIYYPTFVDSNNVTLTDEYLYTDAGISYDPSTDLLKTGIISATTYYGDGVNIVGIVTQIVPGIGVDIFGTQDPRGLGKGVVKIDAYRPIGKTIYVSQNGNDDNTGLTENHTKRTIKAAAAVALYGDTIQVFPGVYVEENPIILTKTVSVNGTELRNCVVTPKYPDQDLFYVNNGCHINNLSFIGQNSTNGAAVVALQPLKGTAADRFFDASRLIRLNLDYISREAVGFLTTGFAGPYVNQDTVKLNNDIKNIWKGICFDITRGGNSKCVGAGLSYYENLPGSPVEVNQTITAIDYSFNVARSIVNNCTWAENPVGLGTTVVNAVYDNVIGVTTITAINHGLSANDAVKIVGLGFTCPSGPGIVTYPSGNLGYVFNVKSIIGINTFEVVVGQSTLPHTYVSGGTIQKYTNFQSDFTQVKDLGMQPDIETGFNYSINSCQNVISALRSCVGVVTTIVRDGFNSGINITYPGNSGIGFTTVAGITSAIYDEKSGRTSITAPTLSVKSGDILEVRDLTFSCTSGGAPSTQIFPSGKNGYEFYVDKVYPDGSFNINVGVSTLVHNYQSGGFIVNRSVDVADAIYDNVTGITTITAPGSYVRTGDLVELRNLVFSCSSGGAPSTQIFPSGKSGGFKFKVLDIVTDKPVGILTAVYDNVTGITTITAPNFSVQPGGYVELRDLVFSCTSVGVASTQIFPSGKSGFKFKVLDTVGLGNTFTVNVGVSTLAHIYEYGGIAINKTSITNNQFTVQVGVSTLAHNYVPDTGVILPPYSKGVGPITQGPYIRNCTNFIPDSIGMKVDGFEAEPGDADDIGVTGTMSVDSYTQYNQGGIGVSITNGGYAQLVSIFTICDDIAIYTASGGQCDLTNSNSSFGNYGLYSNGVGDAGTKSLYRYTGKTVGTSVIEGDVVTVSGLGNYRPYDGQAIYFDTLYYTVQTIVVDDPGSGYSDANAPRVDVDFPEGPSGIRAEASPNVIDGKVVSIDVIASGNQYLTAPKITIAAPPGPGTQATAHSTIYPIYYNLETASLPVNGTSRIVLTTRLNNDIPEGSTVYFSRLSLQIATTISFEWVGAGTNINTAKPALGGITLPNNEVVKLNGGQVVFTSTNQAGNFRIGEGVTVNQLTGTISGRSFSQSLLNTVTPLIIALSK